METFFSNVEVTQQLFLTASLMKEHPVRLLMLLLGYHRRWVLNKGASMQSISLLSVCTQRAAQLKEHV